MVGKYKVITLCGSTRFKDAFIEAQKQLTLEGNIVISVGLFGHSGDNEVWEGMSEDTLTKTKEMLDDMHKRKIDMADEIFVINVGGYIGSSTRSEIEYATATGKTVRYLEPWNHWFNPVDDQNATEAFHLIFRSHFYETALFYYNAVVDISWTLCYVAIEFACSNKGVRVDISGIKPIEEAAELLRRAEGNVTSPTAEDNPFSYLKLMCPEFEPAIDQIISFWNSFSSSEIRKRYNFCKHKGRPAYEEIEKLSAGRVMGFYVKNNTTGQMTQVASDPRDVRYSFSLEAAISELRDFDDAVLFPYVQKLISTIETILKPSPMVF